jgi:CheY-like chemotaxis protein
MIAVSSLDQMRSRVTELLPNALIFDQAAIQAEAVQAALHELPYDLPVIGFAFPGSPGRPRRLPAGVSDYLVKPIGREVLAEAVRALGPDIRSLLVVDDDPAMVRFVTLALESERVEASARNGYRLATAFNGSEALEKLRRDPPDAVLLDLALPDISGWEVLERLRQDPDLGKVPVILITAHDWPQMVTADEQEALQIMMRRPLSRHELASVLGNLLDTIRPAYPTAPAGPAHPTGPSG